MSMSSSHPTDKKRRFSLSKAPDYSAARDTESILKGEKKTPTEADYSPAGNNSPNRCIECEYYIEQGKPESDCRKVIGLVKANGTCDLFEKAKSRVDPNAKSSTATEITIRLTHG